MTVHETGPRPGEPRHVFYLPKTAHRAPTPFGDAIVNAGAGFDQVVATLSPPAAQQLAQILFSSPLLKQRTGDGDPDLWYRFAVDVLASAGTCDPRLLPDPVDVPLLQTGTHR